MGRNKKVECRICFKTMTSDHLKRHMKTHGKRKRFRELDRDRVRDGEGEKGTE